MQEGFYFDPHLKQVLYFTGEFGRYGAIAESEDGRAIGYDPDLYTNWIELSPKNLRFVKEKLSQLEQSAQSQPKRTVDNPVVRSSSELLKSGFGNAPTTHPDPFAPTSFDQARSQRNSFEEDYGFDPETK